MKSLIERLKSMTAELLDLAPEKLYALSLGDGSPEVKVVLQNESAIFEVAVIADRHHYRLKGEWGYSGNGKSCGTFTPQTTPRVIELIAELRQELTKDADMKKKILQSIADALRSECNDYDLLKRIPNHDAEQIINLIAMSNVRILGHLLKYEYWV